MSKKIIVFVVLSTCLTACSMEPASPPAIVVPDQKSVEQQMEKNVEAKAEEYHVTPELSDDFIQQYLDMDSFEELRERTLEGIWITQDQANMTKDEINLWEQVSQAEGFTQYTSKDFEAKKQELNMILEDLAAEQQQTIDPEIGMLKAIRFFIVIIIITKHISVPHVMTINNRIFVRKIGTVHGRKENASVDIITAPESFIEVIIIILCLHNRIITGRVHAYPANNIRIFCF